MSIKSLTTDKQGNVVIPESPADWDQWVSASRTRNYVLEDPLIDWLDLYGEAKGYTRDISDERTDFNAFTMNQGIRFEEYVVAHFKGVAEVETIWEGDYASRYDLSTSEDTFHAMERGVQIIYQGTLRDAESKTYGSPDFLIRSDIVNELFPGTINVEESFTRAPDIAESNWHYVVVDSKFATLNLFSRTPGLRNTEKTRAYKVQVMLYNRMLGRLQGYTPSMAFLLGRGWNQKVDGEDIGSSSAMSKLGPVLCDPEDKEGREVLDLANNAVNWVRSVRSE